MVFKLNSRKTTFLLALLTLLIVATFFYFSHQNPLEYISQKETVTNKQENIYVNEKYNFKFNIPEGEESRDRTYKYKAEEDGNRIIIKEIMTKKGYEDLPETRIDKAFTIYEATELDKDDLVSWWKTNIKKEIGNHNIPQDYIAQLNFVPFSSCIQDASWKLPPSLEVTVKQTVKTMEEPEWYMGSIYMYYNFGKPFILHFIEESTGACGSYPEISTISRLR